MIKQYMSGVSDWVHLYTLRSEALAELDSAIKLYRQREPRGLEYFGLHARERRMPYRTLHELYWIDRNPAHSERKGVIISIQREDEFLEVVTAVLTQMQYIRRRQKTFQFTTSLEQMSA
jgi:hypothetical protein